MNDDQNNMFQLPEPISLQDIYRALPDHLAENEEPFDVEAGLAELHAWIDERGEEGHTPTPAVDLSTAVDVVPPEIQIRRDLSTLMQVKDTELALALAELEKRRVDLIERAQQHTHEMEEIRYRDEMEARRYQMQLDAKLRIWRHSVLFLTRIGSVLAVATTYVVSFIYHIGLLANGITLLLGGYAFLLALALTGVIGARTESGRRYALEAFRMLLLRERRETTKRDRNLVE